ncbi:MAG: hypothetical protein LCH95_10040 [Proteobacteria bacterium]|nr:hypothetical protein [Pseudomonadota bacterium]
MRSTAPSDAGLVDRACVESLDDRLWLVGEVRLDGADELRRHLAAAGTVEAATAGPARLCLLAYARWGEPGLDRIAGDFAFVIWDEPRQVLLAMTDQWGKRPLFHGRAGSMRVVGNALDAVAAIAAPGREADDYWIADFLTLGASREAHRTAYRDVARVPPAHRLRWHAGEAGCRPYWRLDVAEPLVLARRDDYLQRFRDLVQQAIADRLPPAGDVGISMSGGLDSTALAALSVRRAGDAKQVGAMCIHIEASAGAREDAFATMAADHLGIDLRIVPFDALSYDPDWQSRGIRPAEPLFGIVNAHHLRGLGESLAARHAVWFEGEGPDNALAFDRDPYLSWLWRRRDWSRLAGSLASYARVKGARGWLESLRRHARPPADGVAGGVAGGAADESLPRWIDPGLVQRLHLRQRIDDLGAGGDGSHPWHPEAFRSLTGPAWQRHFAGYGFEEALSPVQWHHPYFDLRVMTFLLSVPPIPWAWKKSLLREAMKGWLPEPVLRRPKTGVPVAPVAVALARHGLPAVMAPTRLAGYVDRARLPPADGPEGDLLQSLAVYAVDHWLATRPAT